MVQHFHETTQVRIGSGAFDVRLATTDLTREKGLSGVEELGANEGLLMVYDTESNWGIWMKNMKLPLDIIWLNNNKEVVYIVTNASPSLGDSQTFTPKDPARYVLEVPEGTVKSTGIKVGTKADFNIEEAS